MSVVYSCKFLRICVTPKNLDEILNSVEFEINDKRLIPLWRSRKNDFSSIIKERLRSKYNNHPSKEYL